MLAHGSAASHILHEFTPTLLSFAILKNAYAPGGNVRRVQANDASVADFDIKTEPVGAEHAAGGIEGYRGGDKARKLRAGAYQKAVTDVLSPSHATDQRIVEETALERHGLGKFA